MPLSIVMPTYNGMRYIQQAIDSVFSQDYEDWELLISDDVSTDGTRDFLATIRDPRIKIYHQPKNLNIFGNLNFLLAQVTGDITQILCQDDYLIDNGALSRLLAEWAKLPPEIAFLRANHTAEATSSLTRFEESAIPPIIRPKIPTCSSLSSAVWLETSPMFRSAPRSSGPSANSVPICPTQGTLNSGPGWDTTPPGPSQRRAYPTSALTVARHPEP